jgi:lantibiotic modifying enzyme
MMAANTRRDDPYWPAALAIGDALVQSVVSTSHSVSWEGDDLAGSSMANVRIVRGPVGAGLYSGAAGIAWFLAHLGAQAGEGAWIDVARRAFDHALAEAAVAVDAGALSLFTGASGVALAAFEAARSMEDPDLEHAALALARSCADAIALRPLPAEVDLIAGLAGIVTALVAFQRANPDPRFVAACARAANALRDAACDHGGGASWADPHADVGVPALCGMGHGASGIGWALGEAAAITDDAAIAALAARAFAYERSWFSPARCAWPDLREPPTTQDVDWPGWMNAWCHGAIGIGAVRLRSYERGGSPAMLADAGAALHAARSTVAQAGRALRQGTYADVTLCHGLGGAAELMLLAYEVTGVEEHRRAACRVGDLCLEIHRAKGGRWTTGVQGGEQVPGLFVGLAGIGSLMLRLHDPGALGCPLLPGRAPHAARTRS